MTCDLQWHASNMDDYTYALEQYEYEYRTENNNWQKSHSTYRYISEELCQ